MEIAYRARISVFRGALFCVALLLPSSVYAGVIINEVAWMGTNVSANDEWIELYNNGTGNVHLEGLVLASDGGIAVPLRGSLAPRAYLLLERTDDATVPEVPADMVYTGVLSNKGDVLTLRGKDGTLEDSVSGGPDWVTIGGDNATKETAQRNGATWVTAYATPKRANATLSSPNVVSSEPQSAENVTEMKKSESGTADVSSVGSSASEGEMLKNRDLLAGPNVETGAGSLPLALGGLLLVVALGVGALYTRKLPSGEE